MTLPDCNAHILSLLQIKKYVDYVCEIQWCELTQVKSGQYANYLPFRLGPDPHDISMNFGRQKEFEMREWEWDICG